MKKFKKMVLVDFNHPINLSRNETREPNSQNIRQDRKFSGDSGFSNENLQTSVINRLNREMFSLLNNTSLSNREKLFLHNKLLRVFLLSRRDNKSLDVGNANNRYLTIEGEADTEDTEPDPTSSQVRSTKHPSMNFEDEYSLSKLFKDAESEPIRQQRNENPSRNSAAFEPPFYGFTPEEMEIEDTLSILKNQTRAPPSVEPVSYFLPSNNAFSSSNKMLRTPPKLRKNSRLQKSEIETSGRGETSKKGESSHTVGHGFALKSKWIKIV